MITASTPCRSRSACHSMTDSPTRPAAFSASTSSQDPGKRTTPNLTRRPRWNAPSRHRRSRSPRSGGWPAAARTSRAGGRGRRRRARSAARRGRCAPPGSRARGARAPPPGPADRGFPAWGGPGRAPASERRSPGALQPAGEGLAGDPLVGLDVLLAGARHDLVGNRRGGRRPVPPGGGGPVADELLVEARLAAARLVLVGGPEARGVRGAYLVAERQRPVRVEPELELGVGQDDAPLAGVGGGVLVEGEGDLAHALGKRAVADQLHRPLEVDRLVVPGLGLSGGGEDRLGKLV